MSAADHEVQRLALSDAAARFSQALDALDPISAPALGQAGAHLAAARIELRLAGRAVLALLGEAQAAERAGWKG